MLDALDLLTTRRSFKAVEFGGPPPSAAEIDTLLTVASRVPDHDQQRLDVSEAMIFLAMGNLLLCRITHP